MKTFRIFITGTVQGQLYRKFLEDEGNRIGVRGYVRAMEDGRIEVAVEGIDEKVKEMIDIVKKGTKHAQIRDVQVVPLNHQGFVGFKTFRL